MTKMELNPLKFNVGPFRCKVITKATTTAANNSAKILTFPIPDVWHYQMNCSPIYKSAKIFPAQQRFLIKI